MKRSQAIDRDVAIAAGALLLGGPATLVLGRGAAALLPHASLARPEIAIAALIAGIAALLLALNAFASAAALLSLAPSLPSGLRRRCAALALRAGSGAARRIALRGAASATLGLATFGIVLPGAIAAPPTIDPASDPAAASWLWSPTIGSSQSPASGSSPRADSPSASPASPAPSASKPAAASSASSASPASSATTGTPDPGAAETTPPTPSPAAEEPTTTAAEEPTTTAAPTPAAPTLIAPSSSPVSSSLVSSASPSSSAARSIEVRPGDSLWSLAEGLLPGGASDLEITETWQAIYALNTGTIGDDPSLIHPGDVLALPQERS